MKKLSLILSFSFLLMTGLLTMGLVHPDNFLTRKALEAKYELASEADPEGPRIFILPEPCFDSVPNPWILGRHHRKGTINFFRLKPVTETKITIIDESGLENDYFEVIPGRKQLSIDLGNYPAGIKLIRIEDEGHVFVRKVLVGMNSLFE